MSAWAGTLVFSGALFIEEYGASARLTGVLLAAVALAYLGGNALGGRIHHECLRRALARGNVAAAGSVALTWLLTPNVVVTLALFSFAAAAVAARTVVGTGYGFTLAGERKLEVGAARAAITHAAYLAGSFVGGAGLALGGYSAVGVAFGGWRRIRRALPGCNDSISLRLDRELSTAWSARVTCQVQRRLTLRV
jgi:predicted MFS family arabinose efflux permease